MIAQYRQRLERLMTRREDARRSLADAEAGLRDAVRDAEDAAQAQEATQHVAQRCQQAANEALAGAVRRCLEAVFDEPYHFHVRFDRKRGRTEARLVFEKNGEEVDPRNGQGGGVIDVASFALRLACLASHRPPLRKLLVIDEPFKHLSREYRPAVAKLIEELASETGVQVVMVTHAEELQVGKVVRL